MREATPSHRRCHTCGHVALIEDFKHPGAARERCPECRAAGPFETLWRRTDGAISREARLTRGGGGA